MPREYRNFNNVGKVSCLLLLLLTFLIINPISNSSVFAEENVEDNYSATTSDNYKAISDNADGYSATSFNSPDNLDDTDDSASLSTTTVSTVGISFSPATGTASLSPTNSNGASAQINVLATVSVQNSDGYSVYIKGNNTNLVGKNSSSNLIPGASTAKTYTNMDTNTWGYNATVGTAVPTNATYKAITVSTNGEKIAENTSKKITSDTKNIMLSFAAKINDTKPADTYQNTITLSVISSPLQTTITDLTNMQDMDTASCTASSTYETKQLKDTRDGKFYWVAKLPDGKCWMTQNLDLDLSTSTALTSATSDVSANWTPGFNTATVANSGTVNDASNTETRSWSLGNYRIQYPNDATSCGTKIGDTGTALANCKANNTTGTPNMFAAYTTPTTANGDANAHYILGNHYQWNAATAGTGGEITSGQASSSICPKNWRLPTSTSSGEFQALITAGSIGSDTAKLTGSPYYFVRGGIVYQNSSYFSYAGYRGDYWSSTPCPNGTCAYRLTFDGTSNVRPSDYGDRRSSFSVRCLAR